MMPETEWDTVHGLARDGCIRHEPALARVKDKFVGGLQLPGDETGDCFKFTQALAALATQRGVQFRYRTTIKSLVHDGAKVSGVVTDSGTLNADAVLVALGSYSPLLLRPLHIHLPVYPVKGYSITVNLLDWTSQRSAPTVSLLDDETKLVTSRLGVGRFRVAGTAEFNGFNKDIRADRVRPLIDWVQQCFPGIDTRSVVPWAGLRPMMPNMMPRVGRGRSPAVFYNTGHGHLGWTLSAVTADMIASVVEENLGQGDRVALQAANA